MPIHTLQVRRLGIDTHQEAIIYMRADCDVCRSEGFETEARVEVRHGDRTITATLNVVTSNLLSAGEAGLSEAAWTRLGVAEHDVVALAHPRPLESLGSVRGKVYGRPIDPAAMSAIVADVAAGRYSDIELAAFITACAAGRLDRDEMLALTRAMVDVGERLQWDQAPVVDKHSIGGLPGNRTTLLIVPIVAACGLTMPKTSSRAITSAAGTADTMEMLAPVALDVAGVRRVVEREGGCVVWGGGLRLSPADDVIIRVERPLDLDAEGQLIASVLSKKVAAGSTHVVIDVPVGPSAKVRTVAAAAQLAHDLWEVGHAVGLEVEVVLTDGLQPIGRGIGPALEARDVVGVLRGEVDAPQDLRERALFLAGRVLELGGCAPAGAGRALAVGVLADGRAWRKFTAICEAQGGMREPSRAAHTRPVLAAAAGWVRAIDNRLLARVAKFAGAPAEPTAGLEVHVRIGAPVERGAPLFTVHAGASGELAYALRFAERHPAIVEVSPS
ncbi:MAG: thymidine phosphorylase family protein [Deltaproteobacteria bacterium]|nr:thymidine phosphorylase family protein [Deltaproteobacteria bacterium]